MGHLRNSENQLPFLSRLPLLSSQVGTRAIAAFLLQFKLGSVPVVVKTTKFASLVEIFHLQDLAFVISVVFR